MGVKTVCRYENIMGLYVIIGCHAANINCQCGKTAHRCGSNGNGSWKTVSRCSSIGSQDGKTHCLSGRISHPKLLRMYVE